MCQSWSDIVTEAEELQALQAATVKAKAAAAASAAGQAQADGEDASAEDENRFVERRPVHSSSVVDALYFQQPSLPRPRPRPKLFEAAARPLDSHRAARLLLQVMEETGVELAEVEAQLSSRVSSRSKSWGLRTAARSTLSSFCGAARSSRSLQEPQTIICARCTLVACSSFHLRL